MFGVLTAWASLHTLFPGEQEVARWLQRRDTKALLGYEEFADIIGMRATLYFLSAFGLLGFLVLRKWSLAALVVIAPALTLVGSLVKVSIQRPRPSADQVIALREIRAGYSFPSGHSLQAAIICVVAIIIAQQMLHGRLRLAVQAGAVWLATTIGWERVFDGVHWPTDVVGGFLLGVLATSAAWYGITQFGARRAIASQAHRGELP
jgi:membrane-associated phospholipid phosphatase